MATKKTPTPKVSPKSAKGRRTVVKKETRNRTVYTTYSDGTTEGKPIRRAGAKVGSPEKSAVQKAAESAQKKAKQAKYRRAVEKEVRATATPKATMQRTATPLKTAKKTATPIGATKAVKSGLKKTKKPL